MAPLIALQKIQNNDKSTRLYIENYFCFFDLFKRAILLLGRHQQWRFFQSSLNPFDDTFVVPTFYISSSSSFWKKALMQLKTQWSKIRNWKRVCLLSLGTWILVTCFSKEYGQEKDSLSFYNLQSIQFRIYYHP